VFDRETGKPLFDIDEISVDTVTDLEGEKLWPTQPVPRRPAPYARQQLSNDDINPYLTDSVQQHLKSLLQSYRHDNMFTPPGTTSSIIFPGFDGGGEWGGPAADPETGVLSVNANEMAWVMTMIEQKVERPKNESLLQAGQRLYKQNCLACHGADRKGTGNNPNIVDAKTKFQKEEFLTLISGGRRMMPAFGHLSLEEKNAIASYILDVKNDQNKEFLFDQEIDSVNFMPYKMEGYKKFLSLDGYPAISPPWGTLNAIDLNTGEYVWKIPFGEYPELKAKGIPPTGTENYGGPVVTAGGLVFIAATSDRKFRAFNKKTGKLLWEYDLPHGHLDRLWRSTGVRCPQPGGVAAGLYGGGYTQLPLRPADALAARTGARGRRT
jgi:quinoprotein glucose dehydrogenase